MSFVSDVTFENLDALILQEPVYLLCADKMKSRLYFICQRGSIEKFYIWHFNSFVTSCLLDLDLYSSG